MRFLKVQTCLVGLSIVLNLCAEGEPKMPTLNWMGREKATNAVKDVVMKILREDKALGSVSRALHYGGQVGFTKMGAAQISRINATAFSPS